MHAERPSATALARALRRRLPDAPAALRPDPRLVDSAVLVPLLEGEEGPSLLFTRRSSQLPDHAGQIAFPGGVWEPGDEDLLATALRETAEETTLDPERIERIGALGSICTLAKYRIQPFVGLCPRGDYRSASPAEVERVFQVPLAWLADPSRERRVRVAVPGRVLEVPAWIWEGETIWGATRRITVELLVHLGEGTGLWP